MCGRRCLLLLSVFSLPFLLCVGVRGSARAALRARTLSPNTIASSLVACLSLSLFLFFFAPRLSSPSVFLSFGMAVGVYHVLECCVGMTATGSLSRSSPFFW